DESVVLAPDLANVLRDIQSKLDGRGGREHLLRFDRLDDELTSRQSRPLDGELSRLDEAHIQEILNELVHSRCRTVDDPNRLRRPSLDFWTCPLESRCLHQDR